MRLWSIHPQYLDAKGLVALWREGLLAQKVLQGSTKGYRNHPQLNRFRDCTDPVAAIGTYLGYIADEADKRGYNFNRNKIFKTGFRKKLLVTSGQLEYEFNHLLNKLKSRDQQKLAELKKVSAVKTHSLFKKVSGTMEDWEKR